ncbi:23S rRNA (adenine(2503)-C(2))-methyltransferase RlmN [Candidatus Dojkabacteria bacterium]|nr:23S rRNA (adenine(2503)-C(2))-methyltransferase RlmN [Candidatus Dojkabacteria bacterium]
MKYQYLDILDLNFPSFRQKQLNHAVFVNLIDNFENLSTFSKDDREKLSQKFSFPFISPLNNKVSSDDQVIKKVFSCQDNLNFEAVLLRHEKNRNTVCVSTQIGCPLKCQFCATGSMGFTRNLTAQEIVDQVLYFSRFLSKFNDKVTNIVFMGMGEPFLNPKNVTNAVEILTDPNQFNFGSRRITISSVGIIKPMEDFFTKFPQVNLAISLHSANTEIRSQIMPSTNADSLKDLAIFIKRHIHKNNRRMTLEYLMLENITDRDIDIDYLSRFFEEIGKNAHKLVHVNLIPFNKTGTSTFKPTNPSKITLFRSKLSSKGINVTIRKSLGQEKNAACGMLALKQLKSI